MDALGPHAEGGECRAIQKAAADCLEGLSSFTKQDYAGMKAMEVLKVFSSLACLAALTGTARHIARYTFHCPGLQALSAATIHSGTPQGQQHQAHCGAGLVTINVGLKAARRRLAGDADWPEAPENDSTSIDC